jgi:Cu2+-containing amine oxidase
MRLLYTHRHMDIVAITLIEPSNKLYVLKFDEKNTNQSIKRRAFAFLQDLNTKLFLDVTVNITEQRIERVQDHSCSQCHFTHQTEQPDKIISDFQVPNIYSFTKVHTDLRPLLITQPEGPSFSINGYQLSWQKWRFRIAFNAREGIILHMVEYFDLERWRPIFYRAALSSMSIFIANSD